jgi:hypothetical protein
METASRWTKIDASLRREGVRRTISYAISTAGYLLLRGIARQSAKLAREITLPSPELILDERARQIVSRNASLAGKFAGRRAFVIGTGPSLARQDLSVLHGDVTIGLNSLWRHRAFEKMPMTALCMADPASFEDSPSIREQFNAMRRRLPGTSFVVPLRARAAVEEGKLLPEDRTHFVAFRGELSESRLRDVDLTESVPGVQCVSYQGIYLALYMGCNPIYLLGLDHDWLAYRGFTTHFYRPEDVAEGEVGNTALYPYERLLGDGLKIWRAYREVRRYAESRSVKIINATGGGFLDVFPTATLEEIVGREAYGALNPSAAAAAGA